MNVLKNIVAEHVARSATLWAQRDSLLLDDPPDMEAVKAIDGRLEINLDGLRVAGEAAWDGAFALHAAEPGKGELFVLAWTALELEKPDHVALVVDAGRTAPEIRSGLLGALAWHEARKIAPWVRDWIDARDPFKRFLGISACLEYDVDPKQILLKRLRDPERSVRTAGLRLVAKLRRADLTAEVRDAVTDKDADVRFWAAWTLGELGADDTGISELKEAVERGDQNALLALRAVVTASPVETVRSWIGTLLRLPKTAPFGVRAAGMLGDRTILPWLIEQMANPPVAVAAGASFLELFPEARREEALFTNDPGAAGAGFKEYFGDRIARVPIAERALTWAKRQSYIKE